MKIKLCECGCGNPAPIATKTNAQYGHIKGQPVRFVVGHSTRWRGTLQERFERHFNKTSKSQCWIWQGGKLPTGYGVFVIPDKKIRYAHRASWVIYKRPIPKGMFILHKCDNPPCVNPEHLFPGTPKDNTHDMIKKNRQKFLTNVKLTKQDILNIRKDPRLHRIIAKDYGVARTVITRVKNRIRWKHI